MIGPALRKLYRAILLPAFALLLLGSMWAAVLVQVRQERAGAWQEGVRLAHAQARTLAENATFLLRQADHATQLFKVKYEETDAALRLPEFTRGNGLLASLIPLRLALPVALYGSDGRLADSVHGPFDAHVADAPFFRALAAGGAGTQGARFDTAVSDPLARTWRIRVARRLEDGHGRFAGAIVLLVDPALFIDDDDRLSAGPGALVLLQGAGLAMGRVGDRLFSSAALPFDPGHAGLPEETVPRAPVDQVARLYARRAMPRYGLDAIVGLPLDSVLARAGHRRDLYLAAASVASLVVLGFMALLMQQSRQLRRSTRTAHEAQRQLRAAANASLDALFLLQACRDGDTVDDFLLTDVNERGAALLGRPRADLLGRRMGVLVPAWRTEGFFDQYRAVLATGRPLEEEFETRTGEPRWLHHQIVAIDDGVAVTTRDITARKRAELASRQHQAELAAVNDASPLGLVRADRHGLCTYANRTFESITGMTRTQALGHAWLRAIDPRDRASVRGALAPLRRTLQPFQATVRCPRPDGSTVWVSVKIAPILVDGAIEGFVATLDDITRMRQSIAALRENEARLRTIADAMPVMIAYVDRDEIYRFHNRGYQEEFARRGIQAIGRPAREVLGEGRYRELEPYIRRAQAGETVHFEEDGHAAARSFDVMYIPQPDEDGDGIIGFHVVRTDITARKAEQRRLLKLAHVDALTGLVNRAGFGHKLHDAMQGSREHARLMALMYLDIDRFKPVNDSHGHAVGDALLKAFAGRLTHALRGGDTVARLGGDEFTIVMEGVRRPADGHGAAAKIVRAMEAPFDLDGIVVRISTSIGVTFYRDADVTPAQLLNRADELLYQAKQAGRNQYRADPAFDTLPAHLAPGTTRGATTA